jgi:hypothetical protein
VVINLALSLGMATIAFGIYANGVDWSDKAAKGTQPAGMFVGKDAEIKDLGSQLNVADGSWRAARLVVFTREEQRRVDREWYALQLREMFTGKNIVQMVDPDKGPADASGRPTLVNALEAPMVPLQPMHVYLARFQQARDENNRIRKDLEARVKEDIDLTNQLTGDPDRKTKGIRRLITDERVKQEGLIAETGIVEGLRVNRIVEAELILKRLDSISDRVRELEEYLRAVDKK